MKAALFALSASTLLASASALHPRHAEFHAKRSHPPPELDYGCCKTVVTVTVQPSPETSAPVVPAPDTWSAPPAPAAPTSQAWAAPPELEQKCCKTVVTVTVYPSEPTAAPVAPPPDTWAAPAAPTTSVAWTDDTGSWGDGTWSSAEDTTVVQPMTVMVNPSPEASAAPSAPAAPAGGVVTNGNKWAMTYTPYSSSGACKEAGEVSSDLAAIAGKGFTTIRLYGTDCSGLQNVGGAAVASGMKIILGVFIEASGIEAARPQLAEITAWGSQGSNWASVVMLVVGNEAIQNGYCSAGALAGFISDAKSALTAAGAGSVPVTTTEPLSALMASASALCPVMDVVAANIQSYFNGGIDASQAGSFVSSQLELVAQQCPGKTAYNLESGWPSGGNSNGASVASPDAQRAAIADISAKAGDKTVMFSFSDDAWKTPGPLAVEQHFGCLDLF